MSTTRRTIRVLVSCLCLWLVAAEYASSQVSVWTHRYDNARSGANLAETQLNTSNVNSAQFGRLFSYSVDADIYTQPLVIRGVNFPGKGTHNAVYVATNNNSVYAFDADSNLGQNSQPLWQVSFNGPTVSPVPASDVGTLNSIRTPGPLGVMGTPVIDQTTGTMYLVARTKETTGGSTVYRQRLHALDITTGAERFGGPVVIQASVSGSGYDSVNGIVTFNPLTENQRPGLALANGNVYIAWASYGDTDPYHGWAMSYSAATLQQTGVFCFTPNGKKGGIWQSGQPFSIDGSGNLYVATGNGDYDGVRNFGESIVKLTPGLTVADWFTPDNWLFLSNSDLDLGSSGVLLIPGTTTLVGAGKEGRFYVLNQNGLGHIQTGNGQIVQTFQATGGGNIHGAPAFWNTPSGPWAYVWGERDRLKAFAFNGSTLSTTPISQSTFPAPPGMPGGFLTISANGSQAGSGVLWASLPYAEDANPEVVSGVLRAFDATDLTRELWNTRMNPARDDLGNFAKFVPPTVANGRVYMASFSNRLHVYGLLASLSPPTGGAVTGSGVASSGTVNLSAVGTGDWALWPGYEGNAAGNEQISDFAFLGPINSDYSSDPRTLTWTDGTQTVCGSSSSGVTVSGTGSGFLLTVPADTTPRTVKVYVGGSNSRGILTAHLSDGSAPDFVDTGFSSTGQYDAVYTLNYLAASSGQQLNISWTVFSGAGNVTLQAAALGGTSGKTPEGCGVWVEDEPPLGATAYGDPEPWEWVTGYPTPYSGMLAHQSALAAGKHQHAFSGATATLAVGVGDSLFTYIYLDPANPPSEVMLQWNDGSWEHRAYWGPNLITSWGTDGTNSRRSMGALPPAGQWVRLTVPAALVGLDGATLNGMAFTLYGGRATWDYSGKSSSGSLAPTTTTLVSAPNPSLVGTSVTFTATVTGTAPTGNVAFTDGGNPIAGCTAIALPAGAANAKTAACSTSSLSVATHSIVAAYGGNAANAGSSSSALSQVVNAIAPAPTTTTLASAPNPSTAGTSVTFTATVTGTAPTGNVAFTDGGNPIAGCSAIALPAGAANAKTAACSTGSLSVATHSIVAAYGGDAANAGSSSSALAQVVNAGTTVVWVEDSTPAGATLGVDGDVWNWIGTNPAPQSGALAHQSALTSGEHQHFFYGATTTLAVGVGDSLFTYVYLDPANPPSEIMLQWTDGSWEHRAYWGPNLITFWGTDGTNSRRSMGALPAAGQWVRLTVPAALVGLEGRTLNGMAFTLYGGRATWDYSGKSSSGSLAPTTTTLASAPNPSTAGTSVTFTATVTGTAPTGNVAFTDGGNPIAGCSAIALPAGAANAKTAACSTGSLSVATHSIVAAYGGDAANAGSSSSALAQVVNAMPTTTTLASAPNPSTAGTSVTFTATVTGTAPTGNVAFTDGGNPIAGCSAIALPAGAANAKTAACSTGSLSVATHSIVATYGGNAANASSSSSALAQVVNAMPTTTTLASAPNPSTAGTSVTFTATVTGTAPTGNVAFTDGGNPIAGCTAIALPAGAANAKTAACSTSSLSVATHSIVAAYGGNAANAGSSSSALSQVVNAITPAPTTTTLASAPNPSTAGTSVTFTATVTGTAPTGNVAFTDGGNPIAGCSAIALPAGAANAKTAACSTGSLSVATHSIVAAYGGDAANAGSSSSALAQVVNAGTTVVWVEDSTPAGATLGVDGDVWNWIGTNPAPQSGALAHQSALTSGEHQHFFYGATTTLAVGVGDSLFTYVYLDPANPPSEIMLQWTDGSWEHRAYWGPNLITFWGTDGTNSRRSMGALPAAGQWVRLTVPAALVGLEGRTLNGMAFTLYGGRATWDYSGKSSSGSLAPTTTTLASAPNPSTAGTSVTFTATVTGTAPTGNVAFTDGGNPIAGCSAIALPAGAANAKTAACSTGSLSVATHSIVAAYGGDAANAGSSSSALAQVVNAGTTVVWVEDSTPAGATLGVDGDVWNWIGTNPAPQSGALAHQSALTSGEHQHFFYGATTTLAVGVGDSLFTYVYLDPANPPSEIMLQWTDGSWEHRAYWGPNLITFWGTDGTNSRRSMGALPAAGQWVRLTVPAALVGLEGRTLNGMAFTLYGGRATWDYSGKQ